MWNCPDFLDLPARDQKPRDRGITHVLDKGMPIPALEALLAGTGQLVDVLKIGWGIGYVDPAVKERVALCSAAGVTACLGGTLLEVVRGAGPGRRAAALGSGHRRRRGRGVQRPAGSHARA